ncbi:DUF2461 domain-containing protein [Candidatus Stoquefichus massiliensis]|uniref:DUF2461 domain-containing protein n=1 Tax=Candidatus Stoquefichus massiliensis TaxID=1470350 RepID=UPI000489D7C9|nr:DUF2461 domain-containing protein [Candidatus Stoquefichus massiliensis]
MRTDHILQYLIDLRENNEREWYHAHKKEYQQAQNDFEELIQELILKISEFDESIADKNPHDLTFKLVRDTRFSHDKSPYNPAFRTHIAKQGKLPIPVGYYMMIKPGQSFIGGGLFADMFKDATTFVRDYLVEHPQEWQDVIKQLGDDLKVEGTALKKVPKGYDTESPVSEYLKYKSWYIEYPINDEIIRNPQLFLNTVVPLFKKMKILNDYLNQALIDFRMPERK